ncbi:MAG TPA: hypothetical protein VFW23_02160 [Tepidisphaeraceae bacterium]|nr:hypothetical protein [Tepidisphaeraceae bacterium]
MESKPERLLFIEPQEPPSELPVLDSITRKICAAFRQARQSDYAAGGVHFCLCGAASSCCDHFLPDGTVTNFLCIHYVAHHREAVPPVELDRISRFEWGEADPEENELKGPAKMAAGKRAMIERSLGNTALSLWCQLGLDVEQLCAMMRSYSVEERNGAEELFELLRSFAYDLPAIYAAIKRSSVEVRQWGAKALKLPDWDRSSWCKPMLELLCADKLTEQQRRTAGFRFWYLRADGSKTLQALVELRDSSGADITKAANLAIKKLTGE